MKIYNKHTNKLQRDISLNKSHALYHLLGIKNSNESELNIVFYFVLVYIGLSFVWSCRLPSLFVRVSLDQDVVTVCKVP